VDVDDFWGLIEAARVEAADPSDPELVTEKAVTLLALRPPHEIIRAAQTLWDVMADSYRPELWGAAYQVNGGCSDDGFEYFRGWLLTQGRAAYEAAVADPDSLADLPALRAAVAAERDDIECESALGIADDAYLVATGEQLPADAFAIRYQPPTFDWDFDDHAEARRRLPRLMELLHTERGW
jgi:hypothetical protein